MFILMSKPRKEISKFYFFENLFGTLILMFLLTISKILILGNLKDYKCCPSLNIATTYCLHCNIVTSYSVPTNLWTKLYISEIFSWRQYYPFYWFVYITYWKLLTCFYTYQDSFFFPFMTSKLVYFYFIDLRFLRLKIHWIHSLNPFGAKNDEIELLLFYMFITK